MNLTRAISAYKLRILGMGRKAQKNDSLPGSLDMLILRTLSLRDLHGYGIVQFIQQSSDNELLVEEGSLYPALQRLELNGWINGVWGVTSNNRRAAGGLSWYPHFSNSQSSARSPACLSTRYHTAPAGQIEQVVIDR